MNVDKSSSKLELHLLRFVVDLLYNMLYNKSTVNRNRGVRALAIALDGGQRHDSWWPA